MKWALLAAGLLSASVAACGKKGPPLAPLVLVPARPDNLTAARRADLVHLEFVVPGTNTDGSRPANVTRVDVYGFTGSPSVTDEDLVRLGDRIATFDVNEPPDPDATPGEAAARPAGKGVDQGSTVRVTETLTEKSMTPIELPPPAKPPAPLPVAPPIDGTPPVPAPALEPTRIYVAVPASGRRIGLASRRAAVPLAAAPETPLAPEVSYDDKAVRLRWTVSTEGTSYHVYDVAKSQTAEALVETSLTKTPVADASFEDTRIEWGATRCYTIRAVRIVATLQVESAAPDPVCVTLVDTFPPPVPSNLTAVSSVGAVSLIWDASTASDLAGYIVLKGSPGGPLSAVTPAPVPETTFRDAVSQGTRVAYAVQAVDKAGNVSAPSAAVEETSR